MPSVATPLGPLAKSSWTLDPEVTFLNHGSFGACPKPVLELQSELRARLEREPVQFFETLEPLLDEARAALAPVVGANADDLAFVNNATQGVNTVLRSLRFAPGDEILLTDQGYNACRNAAAAKAAETGAKVVLAPVPFPLASADAIVDAVLARVSPRTKLALLDHITSPTGLVFPIARLVRELRAKGVETLVDGAHAPGMVPVNLDALGAAYYTANCHKWLCAPKGAAFLWVRRDLQPGMRPLSISHGANSHRTDRSRFRLEFDWTGTDDPSAFLCVSASVKFLGTLAGGLPGLMERNRNLALAARALLCKELGVPVPSPDDTIGSLAAIPIPDLAGGKLGERDPDSHELFRRFRIDVPIFPWPAAPKRLLRISAQAYNGIGDYQQLATALRQVLAAQ
jgi:isopenicillin-N epimerase